MEEDIFVTILSQFANSPLWGWHFLVPNDIAIKYIDGKDRRVICTINDHITIHCALMPNKDTWFVMTNQQLVKKMNVPVNSEIKVCLKKDHSKYGMPMPEEMNEVLLQDPDADDYFQALTSGKQRSLIYIVSKVKNSDSRIRKALAIADHLTANKGAIEYKLLNEALKEYNKM
ncbi:MAG: YdeI/OmpD-associated family protein [Saprospiraceae bacterium]